VDFAEQIAADPAAAGRENLERLRAEASGYLGTTPAVARKSYVDPRPRSTGAV
jgi:hypothetical protein